MKAAPAKTRRHPHQPFINFCRSLPQATEDIKWKVDLVFSIGDKMFAVFGTVAPHHFSFKTAPAEFRTLTRIDGVIPAPYLARAHWVAVTRPGALDAARVRDLLVGAYRLTAAKLPRRRRAALGMEDWLDGNAEN